MSILRDTWSHLVSVTGSVTDVFYNLMFNYDMKEILLVNSGCEYSSLYFTVSVNVICEYVYVQYVYVG